MELCHDVFARKWGCSFYDGFMDAGASVFVFPCRSMGTRTQTTTIYYTLPEDRYVKITVVNTLGKEVAKLVDGMVSAGYKSVTFDANSLPSGVYFYRMQAGPSSGDAERHGAQGAHSGQAFSDMKKMLLVK